MLGLSPQRRQPLLQEPHALLCPREAVALDLHHLLGRAGGYTSKATFPDNWIKPNDFDEPNSISRGGSVEVFPDEQSTRSRVKYIQTITAGIQFAAEYDSSSGPRQDPSYCGSVERSLQGRRRSIKKR